jgi:hypothetical protein
MKFLASAMNMYSQWKFDARFQFVFALAEKQFGAAREQ